VSGWLDSIGASTMSMVRSLVAVGLIVLTLSATAIVSASDEEQLVTEGKKLFRTQCARCHGIDGAGGEGANLKRKRLKHAVDDEALVTIINWGIPGTGMPSSILSELEVQELAAYVRFLGQLPEDLPPGDKNRGAELFTSGACLGCHIVKGVGKAIGPELTSIGDQRGLAYLKEALMAPATTMPSGAAP